MGHQTYSDISIHFLYTEEDPVVLATRYILSISIHFLYTEEDELISINLDWENISIHFLYTEEDRLSPFIIEKASYFNPLPLYRGRQETEAGYELIDKFQSTSSIQRKTVYNERFNLKITFQSTSSIQRKTGKRGSHGTGGHISIHFLYTEEDPLLSIYKCSVTYFNPLPLYRGRPGNQGDTPLQMHFNPLPLYRGRLAGVPTLTWN